MDRGPRETIVQLAHSNMPSGIGTGWLFAATPKGARRTTDFFSGSHNAGKLALSFSAVASDPDLPERLYATAREGLFISPDGGDHWIRIKSPLAVLTALVGTQSGKVYGAINGIASIAA